MSMELSTCLCMYSTSGTSWGLNELVSLVSEERLRKERETSVSAGEIWTSL